MAGAVRGMPDCGLMALASHRRNGRSTPATGAEGTGREVGGAADPESTVQQSARAVIWGPPKLEKEVGEKLEKKINEIERDFRNERLSRPCRAAATGDSSFRLWRCESLAAPGSPAAPCPAGGRASAASPTAASRGFARGNRRLPAPFPRFSARVRPALTPGSGAGATGEAAPPPFLAH